LKLRFNSDLNGLEAQFSHIKHATKSEVKAPMAMHTLHQEHGYPHLFWWMEKYMKIYKSRMDTLARAAFSLDPALTEFRIDIENCIEGGATMGFEIVIPRGGLMPVLDNKKVELGGVEISEPLHSVVQHVNELLTHNIAHIDTTKAIIPGLKFWIKAENGKPLHGVRKLFSPKKARNGKIHER
jgi:hypothetical protein